MDANQIPYFQLRVLLEWDNDYKVFAGHCLETGNIVTADDIDTAEELMREVLEYEICDAIKFENFYNLLSKPAPKAVWDRWYAVRKKTEPKTVFLDLTKAEKVTLDDDDELTPSRVETVRA